MAEANPQGLTGRALRQAALRITLVAILAGAVSYFVNRNQISDEIREQLLLSTQERLRRESLPFQEIQALHRDYIREFIRLYRTREQRDYYLSEFSRLYYHREDGAYIAVPEIFHGKKLPDGRVYHGLDALYDIRQDKLTDDVKVKLVIALLLCQRVGTALDHKFNSNQFYNLWANLPERASIAYGPGNRYTDTWTFSGPKAFDITKEVWFHEGFTHPEPRTFFTDLFFDDNINAFSLSVVTTAGVQPDGSHLLAVGTDYHMDELMRRAASPSMPGTELVLFKNNPEGTLIYCSPYLDQIKKSNGKASIASIGSPELRLLRDGARRLTDTAGVGLVTTPGSMYAVGPIPGTEWYLAARYAKARMWPAILSNLAIVIGVGFATLLIELLLLRSILLRQVALPLQRLIRSVRGLGTAEGAGGTSELPVDSQDEIGELARSFAAMIKRVEDSIGQLEDRVRTRTEELFREKRSAESANRAKSLFLANMSHEIRTPMNAVLGFSQVLGRDESLSPEAKAKVATIMKSGEHLLAIINDILEMSRIESGRIELKPETMDLPSMLRETADMFILPAQEKGLEFKIEIDPGCPGLIEADTGKLRQVLINLLANALKFTSRGSILFKAAPGGSGRVVVEVADTGIGISPGEQARLFTPFERTRSAEQTAGGTGLGLAISRQYALLMGGDITVRSETGRGSCFRLDFSAQPASGQPDRREGGSHPLRLVPEQIGTRVLVVDDIGVNRELLRELLEPLGFAIRDASSGEAAVEMAGEFQPKIVLMDLVMPGMGGIEATRILRKRSLPDEMTLIGVTASIFTEDRERFLGAGLDAFLGKPFREADLIELLGRHAGMMFTVREKREPGKTSGSAPPTTRKMSPSWRIAFSEAMLSRSVTRLRRLGEEAKLADAVLSEFILLHAGQYNLEPLETLLETPGRMDAHG